MCHRAGPVQVDGMADPHLKDQRGLIVPHSCSQHQRGVCLEGTTRWLQPDDLNSDCRRYQ